jgi:alpha-L-fucosidase 2
MRRLAAKFIIALSVIVVSDLARGEEAAKAANADGLRTDIEFAKVGDVSLTLDAFVPPGEGPFATCILVHGGGFVRGDKQMFIKPLFAPLSAAGFAWFSINYRLAPEHRFPACAEDVETAVKWVKSHATEYKVDLQRIALIGESAGGHLVSYVGCKSGRELGLAAVLPFYAPHDLEFSVQSRNALGESMQALLGLTELNDEAWKRLREASPISYIHAGLPPFLLIHGDKDPQVPYAQSPRFQERMKTAGNVCDLITIPDGGHGMGGWEKLKSDYQDELVAWLRKTLK